MAWTVGMAATTGTIYNAIVQGMVDVQNLSEMLVRLTFGIGPDS
jgi:hypothetical protein